MPIFSTFSHSFLLFYVSLQLVLFGEIVVAQKVMYDKFGDDFLVHFISKGFSVAHCPPDLAEQYRQKLQVNFFRIEIL
jgi:exportin-T